MGKTTTKPKHPLRTTTRRKKGNQELEHILVRMEVQRTRKDIGRILRNSPLDLTDWASVIHVTPRTLQDRLRNQREFAPLEQDRVLMVDQVMARGQEVFGTMAKFKRWLDTPHMLLGSRKPKELLTSAEGIGAVFAELGRIEHGVF